MKEYASLASQHGIEDIVVAEMQRVNGDQEVRPLFPSSSLATIIQSRSLYMMMRVS